jgi:integrase
MARNEIRLQAGLLQPAHMTQIRAAARGPRELALVECLATARRAEVTRLRWQDVDLETGMIAIHHGKGGTHKWTLMLPSTRVALAAWFAAARSPAPDSWVFPAPGSGWPAQPYTPNGLARIVRNLLIRAGCWAPGLGACHRFRRSFATRFLQQHPGQLVQLQTLMRHRSVSTTSRYVFLAPEDLAPLMAEVRL